MIVAERSCDGVSVCIIDLHSTSVFQRRETLKGHMETWLCSEMVEVWFGECTLLGSGKDIS